MGSKMSHSDYKALLRRVLLFMSLHWSCSNALKAEYHDDAHCIKTVQCHITKEQLNPYIKL